VPQKDANDRWYTPANALRPNPNFCCFRYISSSGDGWYNSLQTSVERRFAQGFGFRTSFTWAKTMDTAGIGQQTADAAGSINTQNSYDVRADKGLSQLHAGRNLTVTFNYEVPVGQGMRFGSDLSGVLNQVIGGWQLNGVLGFRDGQPLNATLQARCSGNQVSSSGTDRPDLVPGASNNPILDSRGDFRQEEKYFDPSAFTVPPSCWAAPSSTNPSGRPGYFGNVGRQTIIGPGLSIFKNFGFGESKSLQFRAEFFNLLNRANFRLESGSTQIDNATAGVIDSLQGEMRQIQLALKFSF
jgi:hypothetical protein